MVQQLVDANVAHTTDFEWASQLRYYWRDNVWVEMVQACIAYGYEYLGNTPRYAQLVPFNVVVAHLVLVLSAPLTLFPKQQALFMTTGGRVALQ